MVRIALEEDVGPGDITAELIPAEATAAAHIITREACVLCGSAWVEEVFRQVDPNICLTWYARDGEQVAADSKLVSLSGPARGLLTGERAALNFLQTLSGTATAARRYADTVAGSGLTVLDTRKTIPGLRLAQKYAVRVGGCGNHRIGLYDAFLIKENHIAACGGITAAVTRARTLHPNKPVLVETENLEEFKEALAAGVDRIMLDDFSEADLAEVARLRPSVPLEVSGGITEERLRTLATAGVAAVSVGALTKHVRAVDLSMRLRLL